MRQEPPMPRVSPGSLILGHGVEISLQGGISGIDGKPRGYDRKPRQSIAGDRMGISLRESRGAKKAPRGGNVRPGQDELKSLLGGALGGPLAPRNALRPSWPKYRNEIAAQAIGPDCRRPRGWVSSLRSWRNWSLVAVLECGVFKFKANAGAPRRCKFPRGFQPRAGKNRHRFDPFYYSGASLVFTAPAGVLRNSPHQERPGFASARYGRRIGSE